MTDEDRTATTFPIMHATATLQLFYSATTLSLETLSIEKDNIIYHSPYTIGTHQLQKDLYYLSNTNKMQNRRRSSVAAKVLHRLRGVDEPLESEGRTAILLLDFQNEFVKKGGKLHGDVADTMGMTGMLENVPKIVDFARKTNAMIIYSPMLS